MSLFLCVDCGGSKTSAVICDSSGVVVGRALGGPSNFAYLGLDAFISAVRVVVGNALKTSLFPPPIDCVPLPSSPTPFAAAWFGVSGVDSPSAVASITPVLSDLLGIPVGPRLIIANDTHLLAAPVRLHSDVSHGVACIAGTGSICVSFEEKEGRLKELGRVGGWGWILGDEGGGFNVGREAIRQILMEHDEASVGGPATAVAAGKRTLKKRVLEHFGVSDVLEILTMVHLPDPPPSAPLGIDAPPHLVIPREKRLSSLSPLVFTSAFQDADPLALGILRTCAGILASQVAVLLGNPSDSRPKAVNAQDSVMCFGGSLFGVDAYRQMVLQDLARRGHVFRYVELVDDPAAVGAAGLAAVGGLVGV